MTDPNMYARLGAVSELRSRLASDNLPAAEGARDALAELARTDIRSVAGPAAAALAEATIQPAPAELHFGPVEQGSAPPHQAVQLLGPPLARACVSRPSHDWILVHQTAGGLDISIDTRGAGARRGSVDLEGPAGQTVIVIDVDLVSPPQATGEPAGLARGIPPGRAQAALEELRDPAADDSSAVADAEAAPVRLPGTVHGITSGTDRPPVPARGATLAARNPAARTGATSAGEYPPIEKRFWYLAVYLLPIVWFAVFGGGATFKRDRLILMNAIQSLEVYLTTAPAVLFFYLAVDLKNEMHTQFFSVSGSISAAFSASLLLYCVIKITRYEQPRIGVLTKFAHRLAYGERQA
jgi:hypothetical protein